MAKKATSTAGANTEDQYSITRPNQLRESVSTRRHDIVDQISAGGPMSIKELAAILGVSPSSLYYHVERLCAVGLLVEAGVRQENNKPERIYATPARRMSLYQALQDPRNRRVMSEIVRSLCKQANRDFDRGFSAAHRETGGPRRNMRFFRLVGRPDAATLELINAHLDAVQELMSASAGGAGERVSLMWVAAPLAVEGDDG